eukprot:2057870-Pyramimonas_sp.AAC.1
MVALCFPCLLALLSRHLGLVWFVARCWRQATRLLLWLSRLAPERSPRMFAPHERREARRWTR